MAGTDSDCYPHSMVMKHFEQVEQRNKVNLYTLIAYGLANIMK